MKQGQSVRLYPQPYLLQWLEGGRVLSPRITLNVQEEARQAVERVRLSSRLEQTIASYGVEADSDELSAIVIRVILRRDLHPQGYILQWDEEGLLFEFSTATGLNYALVTLEQLGAREGMDWDYFRIEDEPDFPVRGLMLDIGRDKIPKMTELYLLIDQMARLKLNHLQLYMEGFCFEYEKYKGIFPESTPMTAEGFRQLDTYASDRFIDLVPNQNCLGHMGGWLNKSEFRELAEHPDGMPTSYQFSIPPTTLNPVDSRSIDLIKDMFDELLPQFSSSFANVNMDEPFGLGTGQSKERCDEIGVGQLYMDYAEKVFDLARDHGKKVLMWGDVLTRHPEVINQLPDDVTLLDWNYDGQTSFTAHCQMLQKNGIPFYVCPGTSAWSSLSGRTDNMLDNISDAAVQGLEYGAGGLIVTDWGDSGHWQVPAISYPGYIYAAGVSWQTQRHLHQSMEIESYASECVFQDDSGEIGHFLMELGRYYHLENSSLDNATYTNHLLNRGLKSREQLEMELNKMMEIFAEIGFPGGEFKLDYQYKDMLDWLRDRKEQLAKLELQVPEADTVIEELTNTLRLIEQGIGLHRYIYGIDLPDRQSEIQCLTALAEQLEITIVEFNRLWRIRNREGGLMTSSRALYHLLDQYQERLKELDECD